MADRETGNNTPAYFGEAQLLEKGRLNMCRCKHPIIQFRYFAEFNHLRDYCFNGGDLNSILTPQERPRFSVVSGCSYCAAEGERFSIKIDAAELDIKSDRAKANFLHHVKNNSAMPEPTNHLPDFSRCPFCGGTKIGVIRDSEGRGDHMATIYYVACDDCQAIGPRADHELEAFDLWNKRSV